MRGWGSLNREGKHVQEDSMASLTLRLAKETKTDGYLNTVLEIVSLCDLCVLSPLFVKCHA